MKKNLLTIGALVLSLVANAQTVLCHVDKDGLFYIGKDALVYNGGGLQIKETGTLENHGNVMLVGDSDDVFKTVDASSADKTDGGNFTNKVNSYASGFGDAHSYGQLYITGLSQANITGVVDQEYQRNNHKAYQQISLPFKDYNVIPALNAHFGSTLNTVRWSEKEVLKWNDQSAVFKKVELSDNTGKPYDYYILGLQSGVVPETVHTLIGVPTSDEASMSTVTLTNGGNSVNFGTGGNATNEYNEKYNTYLGDPFEQTPWQGTYGKNRFMLGNPFLTNLDLTHIAYDEGTNGDGVNISNVYGARVYVEETEYEQGVGGVASGYKYITFTDTPNPTPVGDVEYSIIRPLGVFTLKMKNANSVDFNFNNLRRFKYTQRLATTDYHVTASRNANTSTVKQLGIIALDANGKEIARTYYAVSPSFTTGNVYNNVQNNSVQARVTSDMPSFGSYEENPAGGFDTNVWNTYWLYINEANENDFLGKNIKVTSFQPQIKSYKFEIRENAKLVDNDTHLLSQGEGFYYKGKDGVVREVKHGQEITLEEYDVVGGYNRLTYDFYYGEPNSDTLAVDDIDGPTNTTQIVYNPNINNHIVIFDPRWKKAEIKVYDMSGKLVFAEDNITTSSHYEIKLDDAIKAGYVIDVRSENGQKVIKKILKNK